MLQKRKVTGSDQVSRILHTKNCMRIYLGGLAKQQHAPGGGPPPPPTSKVEDTDVWLRCATCARECCSTDVEYMYLPNLSKPWVPLCHGCCA